MIIIIEGPDGAGKTTLANYLSKQLGYPIKHRSKPKTEEEKQQMSQSYIDDIKSNQNIIWDRCFYSEMVYGPIMRDQSYISMAQMHEMEQMLKFTGALVIYCTDETWNLWERCNTRGETYITSVEQIDAIKTAYDKLMLHRNHFIPVTVHRMDFCEGFKG